MKYEFSPSLNFLKRNYIFLIFTTYIFAVKFYLLVINPSNFGSYIGGLNTFIYYNSKSFNEIAQSFTDWNTPGTPIYYLNYFLSFFLKEFSLKKINYYLIYNHVISFSLLIYSLRVFINYFENKIDKNYILIFLLVYFSFDSNLLSLETIDFTSYQMTLSLLLITGTVSVISANKPSYKYLFYLSMLYSLSLSVILVFIPFVVSGYVAVTTYLIINKKFIKKIIFFNLNILVFLLIYNLPVIGRIPKFFYNVLFVRSDTSFDINKILDIGNQFYIYLINYNIFLFILIIFFSLFAVLFLISKKQNIIKILHNPIYIYFLLLFAAFYYTGYSAMQALNVEGSYRLRGVELRFVYLYISFIFLFFLIFGSSKIIMKIKKVLLVISFFSFILGNANYYEDKENYTNELNNKNLTLNKELGKIIEKNSKIAVYSDKGYGFANFTILSIGNSIFAGEKFTYELLDKFPNLRYLRIADILLKLQEGERKVKISENVYYLKIDNYLKEKLPYSLYLMLTPASHHVTSNSPGSKNRLKDIYIKKNANDTVDYIVFNKPKRIKNINKLIQFLKEESNLKNLQTLKIEEDYWYILGR